MCIQLAGLAAARGSRGGPEWRATPARRAQSEG